MILTIEHICEKVQAKPTADSYLTGRINYTAVIAKAADAGTHRPSCPSSGLDSANRSNQALRSHRCPEGQASFRLLCAGRQAQLDRDRYSTGYCRNVRLRETLTVGTSFPCILSAAHPLYVRKDICRGALTNGTEWIFLILYLNANGEGATYKQSPLVALTYETRVFDSSRIKEPGPDVIAGILSCWVSGTSQRLNDTTNAKQIQKSFSDLGDDDWFEHPTVAS